MVRAAIILGLLPLAVCLLVFTQVQHSETGPVLWGLPVQIDPVGVTAAVIGIIALTFAYREYRANHSFVLKTVKIDVFTEFRGPTTIGTHHFNIKLQNAGLTIDKPVVSICIHYDWNCSQGNFGSFHYKLAPKYEYEPASPSVWQRGAIREFGCNQLPPNCFRSREELDAAQIWVVVRSGDNQVAELRIRDRHYARLWNRIAWRINKLFNRERDIPHLGRVLKQGKVLPVFDLAEFGVRHFLNQSLPQPKPKQEYSSSTVKGAKP